jgi:hypothetical protein
MPDADARRTDPAPPRILPPLDEHNHAFWTGGAEGRLVLLWCDACGLYVHPPARSCPRGHPALARRPVSGKGRVFTFTVNRHAFHPSVPVPYVVAIVELAEQDDLRMITNLVGCRPEDVFIGMPVRVAFERQGDLHVPVFEPD